MITCKVKNMHKTHQAGFFFIYFVKLVSVHPAVMPCARSKAMVVTVWVSTKMADVKHSFLDPLYSSCSEFHKIPLIELVWRLKSTCLIHSSHIIFNSFTSCENMAGRPKKRKERHACPDFFDGLTSSFASHRTALFIIFSSPRDKTHCLW